MNDLVLLPYPRSFTVLPGRYELKPHRRIVLEGGHLRHCFRSDDGCNGHWPNNGHRQPLAVNFLGFAVGPACSWGLEAHWEMDATMVVSQHGFGDATGHIGRTVYELGNVYHATGVPLPNSSPLFWTLQRSFPDLLARRWEQPDFAVALTAVDEATEPLGTARFHHPGAVLLLEEVELVARMMRHACWRGQRLLDQEAGRPVPSARSLDEELREIIQEVERLWTARNRPGGLVTSVARLKRARADYQRG